MKTLKSFAAAIACSLVMGPALAQEGADIGAAPNFIPLQDHFTLTEGEGIYTYWCWNCHGEGPGKPGTTALGAIHQEEVPAILAERTDLDPEYVRYIVRNGVSIMPHFRKTQINDQQLDALVGYLTRNNAE